jgi:hypothetical protein
MRSTGILALAAAAVVFAYGCGEVPPPSPSPSPTPTVAVAPPSAPPSISSPTPGAVVGTIPALDCELISSSIIDYADGLTGVPDFVTATLESPEIEHLPDDQIVVEGTRTAIIRDGATFYIFEWFQPDGGGWLLGGTTSCSDRTADPPSG